MTDLESQLRIDSIYGNCPVQAEGAIAGKNFYFRARGEGWSFSVGVEPVGSPDWTHRAGYDGPPYAAGWMTEEEARSCIRQAAALYLSSINNKNADERQVLS